MMAFTEQLPSKTGSAFRKTRAYIKKRTSKLARKLGKRLHGDAPTRVTKGWAG